MSTLEIKDLHVSVETDQGTKQILRGVDLTVNRGEVVTLLGRNGAGRTTTLRSILGLVGRRTGSIMVNGIEAIRLPTHRIAQLGIGYTPEERGKRLFEAKCAQLSNSSLMPSLSLSVLHVTPVGAGPCAGFANCGQLSSVSSTPSPSSSVLHTSPSA
jgi:ABC-type Mn2+/Zn2+ transport system ATPase subunit